jgi:DNA-binding transcriptional regulator YdaS (Cro superfamily)
MNDIFAALPKHAIVRACELLNDERGRGGQRRIAEACGVSYALVNQWCRGVIVIDLRHFPTIERAVNGRIRQEELMRDEIARAEARHAAAQAAAAIQSA